MPFIIEAEKMFDDVVLSGYVREEGDHFLWCSDMESATRYKTLLDAQVAVCYIQDAHVPKVVEVKK